MLARTRTRDNAVSLARGHKKRGDCTWRWCGGGFGRRRDTRRALRTWGGGGGGGGLRVDADGLEERDEGGGDSTSLQLGFGIGGVVVGVEDGEGGELGGASVDEGGAVSRARDVGISECLDEVADGTGRSRWG